MLKLFDICQVDKTCADGKKVKVLAENKNGIRKNLRENYGEPTEPKPPSRHVQRQGSVQSSMYACRNSTITQAHHQVTQLLTNAGTCQAFA